MSEKKMTFEEIDQLMMNYNPQRETFAKSEGIDFSQVCDIYRFVRPILKVLEGLPLIPRKWREVIGKFIEIMDGFCPVG